MLATALSGGALLAVGATGCATGGGAHPKAKPLTTASGAAPKGKITIWSWDVAAKAMTRLGKSFEQSHPGTTVKVVDIGYDNAYDKITVGLGAGSGLPDVITVEGYKLPSYIAAYPDGLVDITDRAARYRTSFSQAAWATVTDTRGHAFALPWDSGPCGLFHRTDYFRRAGVDPGELTTWDRFIQAGVTIKARTGHRLLVMDSREDTTLSMLLQQQGQGWFKDGRVAVDTPAAVRALTLMKQLVDRGLVDFENGWDGLVSATHDGKTATTPTAAWWDGTLTSEMPDLKGRFGVVPLPAFTDGGVQTSNSGGSTLAVTSQSKNPELAWTFMEFLLADPANQASMLHQEGLFPAYLPALKDPSLNDPDPYYAGSQKTMALFAGLVRDIPPVRYTGDDAKAGDIMNTAVNKVLHNGADPAGVLHSAARQIAAATGRKLAG